MTQDYHVDNALKDLEQGKFSFQMVDCISQHIQKQQGELLELERFKGQAKADLAQYELKTFRLEQDLRAANTAIVRLLKTNALLEQGVAATKYGVARFGEVAAPKIRQLAVEAQPYAIEAGKYAQGALLKAVETAEPHVKGWWDALEPRLRNFAKSVSSSSPKGQN
jgi:hypothetical protein